MIRIERLDDPCIAAYQNLRNRTLRGESIFIAEGEVVVERMLRSRYQAESLLVADECAEMFEAMQPPCPIYVTTGALMREIAGFKFHMGAMAVGRRPAALGLDELMRSASDGPCCVAVCPAINKPENLGLLFRSAAAFQLHGIVMGRETCDPLSRRALRVSMGASLAVPFVRSDDLLADLHEIRQTWQLERVATVLDPAAEKLNAFQPSPRTALMFGNEFAGLTPEWLAACDRRVTIPMSQSVDSLNLGVAAGIFIHHWAASQQL